MTLRTAATLTVCLVAIGTAGGCKGMQDFTAWLTGAPTNAEIDAERVKLQGAEREAIELKYQEADARATVAKLTRTADNAETNKAQVRALYAKMAAELARLEGAAADAMVETMTGLQRSLTAIDAEGDAAADMAAAYAAQADKLLASRRQAALDIAEAESNLDGFTEATQAAISSTLAVVGLAADSAASMGVPGAREVGATVQRIGAGLLGTVLTAGAGGMGWLARRRRKRYERAELRADNLGRVVTATDRFDLLNMAPGPALETAKEGAKEWAGEAAHKELKRTLVENGNLAAA